MPTLHPYGLSIIAGLLAGAGMAGFLGRDAGVIWRGLFWAIVAGLIGARLWAVFFPSSASIAIGRTTAWLLQNPLDLNDGIIAIWRGDFHWFGAALGGALGVLYATRRLAWVDIAAVGSAFGVLIQLISSHAPPSRVLLAGLVFVVMILAWRRWHRSAPAGDFYLVYIALLGATSGLSIPATLAGLAAVAGLYLRHQK